MRCRRCGGEMTADGRCADCGAIGEEYREELEASGVTYEEPPVHVLTDRERIAYRGVTIEESAPEEPDVRFERSRRGWSGMIYTTPCDSWQLKLILYEVALRKLGESLNQLYLNCNNQIQRSKISSIWSL